MDIKLKSLLAGKPSEDILTFLRNNIEEIYKNDNKDWEFTKQQVTKAISKYKPHEAWYAFAIARYMNYVDEFSLPECIIDTLINMNTFTIKDLSIDNIIESYNFKLNDKSADEFLDLATTHCLAIICQGDPPYIGLEEGDVTYLFHKLFTDLMFDFFDTDDDETNELLMNHTGGGGMPAFTILIEHILENCFDFEIREDPESDNELDMDDVANRFYKECKMLPFKRRGWRKFLIINGTESFEEEGIDVDYLGKIFDQYFNDFVSVNNKKYHYKLLQSNIVVNKDHQLTALLIDTDIIKLVSLFKNITANEFHSLQVYNFTNKESQHFYCGELESGMISDLIDDWKWYWSEIESEYEEVKHLYENT